MSQLSTDVTSPGTTWLSSYKTQVKGFAKDLREKWLVKDQAISGIVLDAIKQQGLAGSLQQSSSIWSSSFF